MASTRKTSNRIALLVAGLAISNTACVDWIGDQGMLIIEAAEPAQLASCATPTANNVELGNGVLDLATEVPYTALLRVLLNLPATFNTQRLTQEQIRQPGFQNYGNTDSNTVIIDEVEVYFSDGRNGADLVAAGQLPTSLLPRRSPASGVIFNTQQTLSARDSFFAPAITAEEARILERGRIGTDLSNATMTERIIANIRFAGYTTGGGQIRSSEFSLPIDLCRGCLVPAAACPAGQVLTNTTCSPPGQDNPLTCQ